MTKDEMRIEIAEAMGWRVDVTEHFKILCNPNSRPGVGVCCGLHLEDDTIFRSFFEIGECGPSYVIPDLTLDWMHEVEKTLTDYEWHDYESNLLAAHGVLKIISAPAEQRAEAFLRTKNLWR